MIINEQHDLDKAKESVYILQKGLLFVFFSAQTRFFLSLLDHVSWLLSTQKEVHEIP